MTAGVRDTARRHSSSMISLADVREAVGRRSPSAADRRIDVRPHAGSSSQQLLYDSFAGARRHTRGALVAVSADTMLINAAASRLLTSHDRARLWAWAAHREVRGTRGAPIRLSSGLVVDATAQLIHAESHTVGALIHLTIHGERPATAVGPSPSPPPRFGWASLTDAERGVADQVATGRTNRQVAAALYLSPHTVDAHLRHIYTKLGITSRVQLAHLLLTGTNL